MPCQCVLFFSPKKTKIRHDLAFLNQTATLACFYCIFYKVFFSRRGSGTPLPPSRTISDKSLLSHHSPPRRSHRKLSETQGLSSSVTNLLDEDSVDLSPLPVRTRRSSSSPQHPRLVRASSMTSLGPNDTAGLNEIVRYVSSVHGILSVCMEINMFAQE